MKWAITPLAWREYPAPPLAVVLASLKLLEPRLLPKLRLQCPSLKHYPQDPGLRRPSVSAIRLVSPMLMGERDFNIPNWICKWYGYPQAPTHDGGCHSLGKALSAKDPLPVVGLVRGAPGGGAPRSRVWKRNRCLWEGQASSVSTSSIIME